MKSIDQNSFYDHAQGQIAHAKLDQMHEVTVRRHSLKGSMSAGEAQARNKAEIAEAVKALQRDGYEVSWSKAKGPTGIHHVEISWWKAQR